MGGETAPAPEKLIRPETVRVQVLNGCGVKGAAAQLSKHIKRIAAPEFVVDIIDERNYENFDQKRSILIARKPLAEQAVRFAALIGVEESRIVHKELEANMLDIDYSVVVGADFEEIIAGRQPSTIRK